MLINDNANLNDNELSTECILQVIESPCRREPTVAGQQREKQIRQIKIESYKMREEDKGDGLIQSSRGLNLLSYERLAGSPLA